MSDWPAYPTVEHHPGAPVPVYVAPRVSRTLPTWAGIILATTVGLTVVLAMFSFMAAQRVMTLGSEMELLKADLALLRSEIQDQDASLQAVEVQLTAVKSDVDTLHDNQQQIREAVRQAQYDAQSNDSGGGGIDLMGLWSLIAPFLGM